MRSLRWLIFALASARAKCAAIQLRDIDFDKNIIHITKTIEHKGNAAVIRDYGKTPAAIRQVPAAFHAKRNPTAHPQNAKRHIHYWP